MRFGAVGCGGLRFNPALVLGVAWLACAFRGDKRSIRRGNCGRIRSRSACGKTGYCRRFGGRGCLCQLVWPGLFAEFAWSSWNCHWSRCGPLCRVWRGVRGRGANRWRRAWDLCRLHGLGGQLWLRLLHFCRRRALGWHRVGVAIFRRNFNVLHILVGNGARSRSGAPDGLGL